METFRCVGSKSRFFSFRSGDTPRDRFFDPLAHLPKLQDHSLALALFSTLLLVFYLLALPVSVILPL